MAMASATQVRARRLEAHLLCREGELEVEAAEQDAAIRAGERDDLAVLGLHRFRIAAFEAEDDRRTSRQFVALRAVLRRTLLWTWSGIALLAVAIRTAVATCPLGVGVGPLAARVSCGSSLGRP